MFHENRDELVHGKRQASVTNSNYSKRPRIIDAVDPSQQYQAFAIHLPDESLEFEEHDRGQFSPVTSENSFPNAITRELNTTPPPRAFVEFGRMTQEPPGSTLAATHGTASSSGSLLPDNSNDRMLLLQSQASRWLFLSHSNQSSLSVSSTRTNYADTNCSDDDDEQLQRQQPLQESLILPAEVVATVDAMQLDTLDALTDHVHSWSLTHLKTLADHRSGSMQHQQRRSAKRRVMRALRSSSLSSSHHSAATTSSSIASSSLMTITTANSAAMED